MGRSSGDKTGITVMVAAGGTGGHVFPGLAIAEAIVRLRPETKIVFAGSDKGIEQRIVSGIHMPVIQVKAVKFKGAGVVTKAVSLATMPLAIARSVAVICRARPKLLVCIGGYAAGPLAVAAWFLGVPVVVLEPNAVPGLTNRIIGKVARKIFTAFDEAAQYFNSERVVRTGVPIRSEIFEKYRPKVPGGKFSVFVFGGSQGAMRLNNAVSGAAAMMGDIKDRVSVIHQTGSADRIKAVKGAYESAGIESDVFDFSDSIWECYSKADFVIARAGASTVFELAALGIPSVLVPYPYAADDHQMANARAAERTGGAILVEDANCTPERIADIIRDMMNEPERLVEMRRRLVSLGVRNASSAIALESTALVD